MSERGGLSSTIHGTPSSPASQISASHLGSGQMAYKTRIFGRMEKRLPIAIVVRLTHAQDQPVNGAEVTYTDNVSAHGPRVVSNPPCQPGEVAQVTSLKDAITVPRKVV